jgi:hypothetical protein
MDKIKQHFEDEAREFDRIIVTELSYETLLLQESLLSERKTSRFRSLQRLRGTI